MHLISICLFLSRVFLASGEPQLSWLNPGGAGNFAGNGCAPNADPAKVLTANLDGGAGRAQFHRKFVCNFPVDGGGVRLGHALADADPLAGVSPLTISENRAALISPQLTEPWGA